MSTNGCQITVEATNIDKCTSLLQHSKHSLFWCVFSYTPICQIIVEIADFDKRTSLLQHSIYHLSWLVFSLPHRYQNTVEDAHIN